MISRVQNAKLGLRLRTLALLLHLIAIFSISLTFMSTTNNNFLRIQTIFNNSNTVIFEAETSRQLEYSLQLYQVSISQAIASNNHSLISMQELYTVIQNEQEYIHTQTYPEYILSDASTWHNTQFGFKSSLYLDQQEYSSLLNFTRLLNEYMIEFQFSNDNQTIVAYLDYGPAKFYLQYPVYSDNSEFFKSNSQFLNFKKSNLNSLQLTPIFNVVNGPIYLTNFQQVTDSSNSVKGSLLCNSVFSLAGFPQLYTIIADRNQNIHTYFGVVNSSSTLIPDPNYPEINLTLQFVTGFNQDNWVKIMTEEQSFVYNEFLRKNVFAKKSQFENRDMLLVVYQDVSSYLIQQDQIMTQLSDFGTEVIQRYYIALIACISICGFFQVIIILKILQPFAKLTLMVQIQIYSISKNDIRTSFVQQLYFKNLEVDQSLKELYSAIMHQRKRSSEEKSVLCSIYQKFGYPSQNLVSLNIANITQYELSSKETMSQSSLIQTTLALLARSNI